MERREGHDGSSAGVNQLAGGDEIVVGVRQNDEAFLHEDAGGFHELLGVREKSLLIADDFELDPVGEAHFAGQARGANGFVGGVARRGIRQNKNLFAVDVVEQ